ncbi:hypothetical protein HYU17_01520 [Candidatus Woesearchaeota archaeon]|nr:hypothetical protein [Candidatus Woesearchaeota archaeon]
MIEATAVIGEASGSRISTVSIHTTLDRLLLQLGAELPIGPDTPLVYNLADERGGTRSEAVYVVQTHEGSGTVVSHIDYVTGHNGAGSGGAGHGALPGLKVALYVTGPGLYRQEGAFIVTLKNALRGLGLRVSVLSMAQLNARHRAAEEA